LSDLERKIAGANRTEELFGGEGVQLRVAVQHEKDKPAGPAEVHDDSDDVYYVLDGAAHSTRRARSSRASGAARASSAVKLSR